MKDQVFTLVEEFNSGSHGRTDYDQDDIFVMGSKDGNFVPFSFLTKKIEGLENPKQLQEIGFIYSSYILQEDSVFEKWYEAQFAKKVHYRKRSEVAILQWPDQKAIFDAVEGVNKYYDELRKYLILVNGKNLPVQLGEWYAKVIFGLKQKKSTSQRGFDFYHNDIKIEVMVHWADQSSPKGVKLKKSLITLSDHCIVIYLSKNFMIRDICFLDSDFIERKFTGKGHTIFLKDLEVSQYFFSKSDKHFDKVVNKTALMRFAQPQLAMKLDGRL